MSYFDGFLILLSKTPSFFFQKLVITPVKKDLGLAFKGNQKMVVEALLVHSGFFFLLSCLNSLLKLLFFT